MPEIEAEIEIAESLYKHAILLGKSKDPDTRIAAAKAEKRLKNDLDELREKRTTLVPA